MKYEDRKDHPDIENFKPEEWELIGKDEEIPDFVKKAVRKAHENISKRGGKRVGAGRPNGSTKEETRQVRLPVDIAEWIKRDKKGSIERIRSSMSLANEPEEENKKSKAGEVSKKGSKKDERIRGKKSS